MICILVLKTTDTTIIKVYLFSLQLRSFNLTPLMEGPQNLLGKAHFWVPAAVDLVPLEGSLFFSLLRLCGAEVFSTLLLT